MGERAENFERNLRAAGSAAGEYVRSPQGAQMAVRAGVVAVKGVGRAGVVYVQKNPDKLVKWFGPSAVGKALQSVATK